jgi:membrane-bound lytic murein transglycosylase D
MLVESGGRLNVTSPKGARGPWQFMPATARRYGLVVSGQRDDRTDIVLATRAAARHLRDLYKVFGDWDLALAAYNYGEGGVQRVLKRLGATDFRSAAGALPAETRLYVPAVTAAARLLRSGMLHMPKGREGEKWFATTTRGN